MSNCMIIALGWRFFLGAIARLLVTQAPFAL